MADDEFTGRVLAQIAVTRAFAGGRLGAFIENVPAVDPQAFLSAVAAAAASPVRVALLGIRKRPPRAPAKIELTTDPTEANRWRNDKTAKEGKPSIFLVMGPAAKLNSLRTAVPIVTSSDLRDAAVKRGIELLDTPERRAFYRALGERSAEIPTPALLTFVAAAVGAAERSRASLLESEPKEVRKLGLLPSASLLASGGVAGARRALRRNLDALRALRGLSPRVREHLAHLIEAEDALSPRASSILRYEFSGRITDLGALTLEEVEETLRLKKESKESSEPQPRPRAPRERLEGDALALDLVLNSEGRGLSVAAKRFKDAIEPDEDGNIEADEVPVGKRSVQPRVKVGTAQSTALFGKLLSEETWGGVISAQDASDFVAALKLVSSGDAEVDEFRPGDERRIRWTLKRAADQGLGPKDSLAKWDAYAAARADLLPSAGQLIDHPLLALAGNDQLLQRAKALLLAYSTALEAIQSTSAALEGQNSIEASKRLLADALALDVCFVRTSSEFVAIAAPTHPFHLWRWTTLLEVLQQHKEELETIGRDTLEPLVTDPPAVCPQLVLSPFAVTRGLDRSRPFIPTGNFGALPLFGEPSSKQSGKFRARSLAKIAERLLRLMPHASFGLRVVLVDPPSVAGALEDLLELKSTFDEEVAVPIHAVVARTQTLRESTDEEEDEVAALARELKDQGGTLTVLAPVPGMRELSELLVAHPSHITVVFHPGAGEPVRVGLASPPPLSPLAAPRAYRYDPFDDRLDVVVAGDTAPFGLYHDVFCRTLDIPRTDFVGRRSGASKNARFLESIARTAVWTVIVDECVEPTLRITGAERLDWRADGGRDVVTYTAHTQTIEELVGDALRSVGLAPDEESRKRLLQQLFLLSGEAVLTLAKARPGTSLADPRIARGTIGVLAANRWYTEHFSESIVVSLDDPMSRRWVLGVGADDRHGDLIAIRSTTEGVVIDVIEVKAHDAEDAGVTYHSGTLEGKAVTQIDQTIAVLKTILPSATLSPVARARQDVLRDQLYRAVASRPYAADQRARFVRLLEELFSKGPAKINGVLVRVRIAPGAGAISPSDPKAARSPAGNSVSDVELTEGGPAPRRRSPLPPPPPPPTPGRRRREEPEHGEPPPTQPSGATSGVVLREGRQEPVAEASDVRVLIGNTPGGSQVYWEPHLASAPLNNFGVLVTGDSGSGKTQIIKALIAGVVDCKLPVCVFDFKNDYSGDYARKLGLQVYDIDRQGLPFNPLSLVPDERGEAQPMRQVHEIAGILRRIFSLGDQQEARLKKAIAGAYEAAGIRPDARRPIAALGPAPSFNDVKELLGGDDKSEALLNRLSPLFDLSLFPEGDAAPTTFSKMIEDRVVLDLHSLPTEPIKAAMSEFIIVRLHNYMLRGEQPRRLRRMLVLDEAWRVKDSQRLQELAREGRAFGVGLTIGTQFPGDIPENLGGNLATQLLLANQDPEHRRAMVRTLCGATSGPAATQLMRQVSHLHQHEGFFRNAQYAPYALVKTVPYFERSRLQFPSQAATFWRSSRTEPRTFALPTSSCLHWRMRSLSPPSSETK